MYDYGYAPTSTMNPHHHTMTTMPHKMSAPYVSQASAPIAIMSATHAQQAMVAVSHGAQMNHLHPMYQHVMYDQEQFYSGSPTSVTMSQGQGQHQQHMIMHHHPPQAQHQYHQSHHNNNHANAPHGGYHYQHHLPPSPLSQSQSQSHYQHHSVSPLMAQQPQQESFPSTQYAMMPPSSSSSATSASATTAQTYGGHPQSSSYALGIHHPHPSPYPIAYHQ
jgi:hypothetical protein